MFVPRCYCLYSLRSRVKPICVYPMKTIAIALFIAMSAFAAEPARVASVEHIFKGSSISFLPPNFNSLTGLRVEPAEVKPTPAPFTFLVAQSPAGPRQTSPLHRDSPELPRIHSPAKLPPRGLRLFAREF